MTGGQGRWITDGEWHEIRRVEEITFSVVYQPEDAALFRELVRRLEGWRDGAEWLDVYGAPGKMTLVVARFRGESLPFPRNWPPPETLGT